MAAVISLLVTFSAAWFGSRFKPNAWYQGLSKPSWNPPNAVFAPVWTVLYLLMAIAAWLVWKRDGLSSAAMPLTLFTVQLVLNAVWSWLFFGRHNIQAALIDLLLLWAFVLATIASFYAVEPLAAILLIPYLLWVSFAGSLNWTIWRLNRRT